jgi:hypothetical protein
MALLSLTGMILLPHDKYLRYQSLNDHSAPRAYWIYERIHNDPTPIDIAFIGTSRTGRSIHTRRLEEDLAQRGVTAKAANLFMFKTGRNMHYAIAKELFGSRKVKLLVLEITEWEDRKPHPDFVFLADPEDIVFAPWFINLRYLSDLSRLPGRQVDLFLQTQLVPLGLRKPEFVPPPYEGPNLDISEYLVTLDGKKHYFTEQRTFEHMEALRKAQDASITPSVLPKSMDALEYRLPRYYISRILDLARQHGTKVIFLYVPRYGGPATPAPYARYQHDGPLINPGAQMQDYRLWDEVTHLNWDGAKVLTDYVARELASSGYLGEPTPAPVAADGGSAAAGVSR